MPTYEYACKSCDEHLEVVQSFKDDPLTECPHCGGRLRKVFGAIGISFKGSGFYKTDSRKESKTGRSDAPAKAKEASGGDSSSASSSGDKTPAPAKASDSGSSSSVKAAS